MDPDQAQEWMNGIGKKIGGIIGITKTPSALFRWTLSYSLRTHIAAQTREMYHLGIYHEMAHNESNASRRLQDHADEKNVMELLQKSAVFSDSQLGPFPEKLQNIVTKDIATAEIQDSLLNACSLGQEKLITFVKQRLMQPKIGEQHKKLRDPLPKNKPDTFATLHRASKKGPERLVTKAKAERNILQRIITAYDTGREVNLVQILRHELMDVPTAVADSNGYLRSGNKSILSQLLCGDVECPAVMYPTDVPSTLVIDGQAFVMTLGQPSDCNTFREYADKFVRALLAFGKHFQRIDIIFDRYRDMSIKSTTRQKRTRGYTPIRRAIEDGSVPLPKNWSNFLALEKNKEDLAQFLSDELLAQAPANKIIIAAGGFKEENTAKCSNSEVDITALQGYHEEADTRIVLHCVHSNAKFLVVSSQDTDVLLLFIAHFDKMQCKQLWMRMGSSKKPRHIPIHTVRESLRGQVPNIENVLSFHAITGCDTISYFVGHGKKTSWKAFLEQPAPLDGIGLGELTETTIQSAEKFIFCVYDTNDVSCNDARATLFSRCQGPEALPPTSDAAQWHIKRAHYQALVWRQAYKTNPILPPIEEMGWSVINGRLEPKLMSVAAIPKSCSLMVTCRCSCGCKTSKCSCRTAGLLCTGGCKCRRTVDHPCQNASSSD